VVKMLGMGNKQIEEGTFRPADDVFADLDIADKE